MVRSLVTIYGDSITKGVLLEDGRYCTNSRGIAAFAEKFSLLIRNRSKFGCTIGKGIARLRHDLDAAEEPGQFTLLEYGGNDCDFDWAEVAAHPETEHTPQTPLDEFLDIYRSMLALVRGTGSEPILMSPPPVCAHKYLDWICRDGLSRESILRWLGEESTIYRWQDMYARSVCALAQETGTLLIDVRGAFLDCRRLDSLVCDDGIHPSARGQKLIFDVCGKFAAEHGLTGPIPA